MFLVRWPGPCASLVAARDEDDLVDLLDGVEGSERATWSVYDGPLHVDFELPVEFHPAEKDPGAPPGEDGIVVVDDVTRVEDGELVVGSPEGDPARPMMQAVLEKAFPHVHAALAVGPDELTEDALRAAVRQELLPRAESTPRLPRPNPEPRELAEVKPLRKAKKPEKAKAKPRAKAKRRK